MEIKVFDLTKSEGNFETALTSVTGRRTFGLWSYNQPEFGDLVVIQRINSKVCYEITDAEYDFRSTHDGNRYWRGVMEDRGGRLNSEQVKALKISGL